MFHNNSNPDYYNDAIKNARVNTQNRENIGNLKGKLLLILNLILISTLLGYFIYQEMNKTEKTEVMGVSYTVDVHEEENNEVAIPPAITDSTLKQKETSISEEKTFKKDSTYIQALDNELDSNNKKETSSQSNKELENILEKIDTEEFSQTKNVVNIKKNHKAVKDLDINELAEIIDSIVLESE